MKKHKNGFTLAEVLITLVIIGIIAAMTIPTLMNKTNEQETVVAVKKAYSVLSQAYQRMIADNGEVFLQNLGTNFDESIKTLGDTFVSYLNVQKNCGQTTDGDCWATGMYKHFDGSDWGNFNKNESGNHFYLVRLSDGMSLQISAYPGSGCEEYGETEALKHIKGHINVDINGDKGPNISGKDVFSFWITQYGVVPFGTAYETRYSLGTCRSDGNGCAAWVITKGNMDYLRKDVSW